MRNIHQIMVNQLFLSHPLEKESAMLNPQKFTVELLRWRHGERDVEHADFDTFPETWDYAKRMCLHYNYRVWIDNLEHTKKDFE